MLKSLTIVVLLAWPRLGQAQTFPAPPQEAPSEAAPANALSSATPNGGSPPASLAPTAAPTGLASPAPERAGHRGFFARVGLGAGYTIERNRYHPDITENAKGTSYRLEILLGSNVLPGLILGGGLCFSMVPDANFSETVIHKSSSGYINHTSLLGFLHYYVNPEGGFQLMAFAGVGQVMNVLRTSDKITHASVDSSGYSAMAGFGLGWDTYVSRHVSLGLMANVSGYFAKGKMSALTFSDIDVQSLGVLPTLSLTATYD